MQQYFSAGGVVTEGAVGDDVLSINTPGVLEAALMADYRTKNDKKIIGVNDPYLRTDPTTLTQDVDFSTYGDRAIIKLTNSTGTTVEWRGACIVAKPIVQYSNANGYKWTYSDYADIERNGEKSATIGNDYIISSDQVESIGDYWSKELKPHNVYSLVYPGCLYHLQRGDVWHLTLSYTCPGGISESELIDVDVEIVGTEIKKSVGGIGETIIDCRVPSGAWSKTTSRRARLIGAGKADYLLNRSNTLTVAASTWTGQADLFCDGTADGVQIQAAIDRLAAQGGGEVILTQGAFTAAATITMKDNVWLHGSGSGTIIKPASNSITTVIDWGATAATGAECSDFTINGSGISYSSGNQYIINGRSVGACTNVIVDSFDGYYLRAFHLCNRATACSVSGSSSTTEDSFSECNNVTSCMIEDSSGTTLSGFYSCLNISNCMVINNSVSGLEAFAYCHNITSCTTSSNTASSSLASFKECSNITSCLSESNTASVELQSFLNSRRIVSCNSDSNVCAPSLTGFENCRSVQQCRSIGDTTPYYLSYADSGTSNACADTAAGGYCS